MKNSNSTTPKEVKSSIKLLQIPKHLSGLMILFILLFSNTTLFAQNVNLCEYELNPNFPITINEIPNDLSGVTYNPQTNSLPFMKRFYNKI